MKLSIIIPLYNTEKYVEKCIRSIYIGNELPLSEYEVLVVNDGSTDNGPNIVERLCKEYPNITLFNKENGGQGSARNLAFEKMKGDYILFLDSDDYLIAKNILTLLDEAHHNNLDCLSFNLSKVDEDGNILYNHRNSYSKITNIITGAALLNNYAMNGAMCSYLFSRKIISSHNLKFIEGIYHEDEEFIARFLSYTQKFQYSDLDIYRYLQRVGSTMSTNDYLKNKKKLFDIITVIDSLTDLIDYHESEKYLSKGLKKKQQQLALSIFIRISKEKIKKDDQKIIIDLLKSKGYYPLKTSELKTSHRTCAFLINYSPFISNLFIKYI